MLSDMIGECSFAGVDVDGDGDDPEVKEVFGFVFVLLIHQQLEMIRGTFLCILYR